MSADVAVVILAGGEGTRIGGGKPLRFLGGQRLIDRALQQAKRWSSTLVIAIRADSQVEPIDAVLIDDDPDVEGPLGGLIAGLRFARDAGCELLLTIPSDMPFLPTELLDKLRDALADHGSALASSGGHMHPVCGLWRTASLDRIPDYVASGRRSLRGFANAIGCVEVEWSAAPADPFFNINSAQDLAEAERRLAG
jgi:molybdopterin-guanine dinucleotide biosynthesis protein A